jgi:thioesterase domain-containing protein
MRAESPFGRDYLQSRIAGEFPLARHIGIVVESAGDGGLVLTAPLAANANFKGTAFGGSQFCIAVLAGWAWAAHQIAADAVVQESTIHYLAPVQGALRASLRTPPVEHVEKFRKMLLKAGRGRIRLHVDIHYGRSVATQFDGTFVAAVRPQPAAAS